MEGRPSVYFTIPLHLLQNSHFTRAVKNIHIYQLCQFLTVLFKWLEIILGWFLNIVHDKGVITFR